jgi:L-ascorbate metabolism protein UlaG (beta-lactamase superfamily)
MFTFGGKVIHVDPYGQMADYAKLPKADLILITHEHRDHFDPQAVSLLRTEKTVMILTNTLAKQVKGGIVMNNGDVRSVEGLKIEAIAAYNIVHKRGDGTPFHPKGIGNGYVITFGDKKIYVARDTENIPQMKVLKDIDVVFLPMNAPFTITPEMATDAANAFKPKILYPYHYEDTDPSRLVELLKDTQEIEVRIRKMR